jgi:ADP-heptose:LPS heptosyltransferase
VNRYGLVDVLIEPNVPLFKTVAPNKQWPAIRYQKVADELRKRGFRVAQPYYQMARTTLKGVEQLKVQNFRQALALLRNVKLYIGPEGGLHHGSAAMAVNAVVIFGGFIPPSITGYASHSNLAGSDDFCGSLTVCAHCRDAMARIEAEQVIECGLVKLSK